MLYAEVPLNISNSNIRLLVLKIRCTKNEKESEFYPSCYHLQLININMNVDMQTYRINRSPPKLLLFSNNLLSVVYIIYLCLSCIVDPTSNFHK